MFGQILILVMLGMAATTPPAQAYITHGKSTATLVRDAQIRYEKAEDLLEKADRCERERSRGCADEAAELRQDAYDLIKEANEIMAKVKEQE